MKSSTAGWEIFSKFLRDEHVIPEHTVLGIIAPEVSILFQNEPKSLAAEVPPQGSLHRSPCRPLAVMDWDGDLVTIICAPCS